jgi:GAF domain-containing protein/HAMP domain-containing protein
MEINSQIRPKVNNRLETLIEAIGAFGSPFALLIAFGYGIMYYVTRQQEVSISSQQLIFLVIAACVSCILYIPVNILKNRGWFNTALVLIQLPYVVLFVVSAIAINGISIWLLLLMWILPAIAIALSDTLRQRIISAVIGLLGSFGIFIAGFIRFEKLQLSDNITLAIVAFLILSLASAGLLIFITRFANFKSLSNQLIGAFIILVTFPALTTALILSVQSYSEKASTTYQQLGAVNLLDTEKINDVINLAKQNSKSAMQQPNIIGNLNGFYNYSEDNVIHKNSVDYLLRLFEPVKNQGEFVEIFLLDFRGYVVLSTNANNIGLSFTSQPFFLKGLLTPSYSTTVTDVPQFGGNSFLISQPFTDYSGVTRGVVVFRTNYDKFQKIVQGAKFIVEDETYLVGKNYQPLSATIGNPETIITTATSRTIGVGLPGFGTYQNYDGVPVLGSYTWIPALEAGLITEASQSKVQSSALVIVGIVLAVSLLASTLAAITAVITAQSISSPLSKLVVSARELASGDLKVRSSLVRADEVGTLSNSFNSMADRLQQVFSGLEQSIEARTQDIQRQATRLRVAAEVARDTTGATDLNTLLNRSTQIIRDRFGFYHAGVFLIDSNRENAILSAATGEAGRLMLETGHSLRIGEGLVGNVALTGEPRIALDTGADVIHFRNPLLPATRSELALPLKVYNRIVGVLDVQSDQENAFTDEDSAALQIVADQLAVAIENTRLFQDAEKALQELQRNYQQYTQEGWRALSGLKNISPGYTYQGANIKATSKISNEAKEAFEQGATITEQVGEGRKRMTRIAIPLKLRGQVIGVINLQFSGESIDPSTISIIEETANRLAQTLETSRLILESRLHAQQERALSEAAVRIGSSTEVDTILKSTIEELTKLLGDSDIAIQINPQDTGTA